MWLAQTQGAKCGHQVVTELKNRSVQDIFIAGADELKGFPEAILTVPPKACVQPCSGRMLRNSLNFGGWQARNGVVAGLTLIYTATTIELAAQQLPDFEANWAAQCQSISRSGRGNRARITRFFDGPPEIRPVIYTTNTIESSNMSLRKVSTAGASVSTDNAVSKWFYLTPNNTRQKRTAPLRNCQAALKRFASQFDDRRLPA